MWLTKDKKILKRINSILKDISRNPFDGIGKPEKLKGDLSGYQSCRIDEANRIVYRIKDDKIEVYQCMGHYNK